LVSVAAEKYLLSCCLEKGCITPFFYYCMRICWGVT
jgi:hypothetical protein